MYNVRCTVQIEMCGAALSLLETDSTVCEELKVGIQISVYA